MVVNDGVLLGARWLLLRDSDGLSVLHDNWLIQVLVQASVRVHLSPLLNLEDRLGRLDRVNGHIRDGLVLQVDIGVLLSAATARLLGLDQHIVRSLAVLVQLRVPVEALITVGLLTLVELGLRVAAVMLSSIAARGESPIAEMAFERSLASVHSLVHLEVRLVQELFSTDALDTLMGKFGVRGVEIRNKY